MLKLKTTFFLRKITQFDLRDLEELFSKEKKTYYRDAKDMLRDFLSYDEKEQLAFMFLKNGKCIALFDGSFIDDTFSICTYTMFSHCKSHGVLSLGLRSVCNYIAYHHTQIKTVSFSSNPLDLYAQDSAYQVGFDIESENEYNVEFSIHLR